MYVLIYILYRIVHYVNNMLLVHVVGSVTHSETTVWHSGSDVNYSEHHYK
jgi:uncharacterized protein YbcI